MEKLDIIKVIEAATKEISDKYFSLHVAKVEGPISRERVYCYELYHQLRRTLAQTQTTLTLTPEPDKQRHPDFEIGKKRNPDLILHDSGSHQNNNAVIEVQCRPTKPHLKKDLNALKLM